jgi:hypothetical protein
MMFPPIVNVLLHMGATSQIRVEMSVGVELRTDGRNQYTRVREIPSSATGTRETISCTTKQPTRANTPKQQPSLYSPLLCRIASRLRTSEASSSDSLAS